MYITAQMLRDYSIYDEIKDRTDDELADILMYVAYRIEAFCGQSFTKEDAVEKTIHGNGLLILDLPQPISLLTTIKFGDIEQTLTDFIADGVQIFSKLDMFPQGFMNIKIKGNWGFATVPEKVVLAAKMLAEDYTLKRYELDIENRLLELAPFESQTMGGFNYKLKKAKPDEKLTTGNMDADVILGSLRVISGNDSDGRPNKRFFIEVI